VNRDPLAAMEHLDCARGDAHLDLGANERMRNRVEEVVDLDVRRSATDAPIASDAFVLKPPAGAKKIEFKDLSDVDEVPPGVVKGGKP